MSGGLPMHLYIAKDHVITRCGTLNRKPLNWRLRRTEEAKNGPGLLARRCCVLLSKLRPEKLCLPSKIEEEDDDHSLFSIKNCFN